MYPLRRSFHTSQLRARLCQIVHAFANNNNYYMLITVTYIAILYYGDIASSANISANV